MIQLAWTKELEEIQKLKELYILENQNLHKEIDALLGAQDEVVTLLYSRRSLEVIITELCEEKLCRERGTEPLNSLIDKLYKEKFLPEYIQTSMQNLNRISTFGAHPKEFDPRQVRTALIEMVTVLEWFFNERKYKKQGGNRVDGNSGFEVNGSKEVRNDGILENAETGILQKGNDGIDEVKKEGVVQNKAIDSNISKPTNAGLNPEVKIDQSSGSSKSKVVFVVVVIAIVGLVVILLLVFHRTSESEKANIVDSTPNSKYELIKPQEKQDSQVVKQAPKAELQMVGSGTKINSQSVEKPLNPIKVSEAKKIKSDITIDEKAGIAELLKKLTNSKLSFEVRKKAASQIKTLFSEQGVVVISINGSEVDHSPATEYFDRLLTLGNKEVKINRQKLESSGKIGVLEVSEERK